MATPMAMCCLCLSRLPVRTPRSTLLNGNHGTFKYAQSILRDIGPVLHFGSRASDYTQEENVSIPVDRLKITYSRSSGPGGQHVNKVSTKAEVRFHVQTADWIPEEVRTKIQLKNKTRINKAGELMVTSEVSRSQQRNLGDCLQKITDIIIEASQKPPEASADDVALRAKRLEKKDQERLKQKKIHSAIKQTRRVDID